MSTILINNNLFIPRQMWLCVALARMQANERALPSSEGKHHINQLNYT